MTLGVVFILVDGDVVAVVVLSDLHEGYRTETLGLFKFLAQEQFLIFVT